MKNYIVCVYGAHPSDLDSISGDAVDIESGKKDAFQIFNALQSLLTKSIRMRQFDLSYNSPQEEKSGTRVAINA